MVYPGEGISAIILDEFSPLLFTLGLIYYEMRAGEHKRDVLVRFSGRAVPKRESAFFRFFAGFFIALVFLVVATAFLASRFCAYLNRVTFMFWLAGAALLSGAFCALVFRRRVSWHEVRIAADRLWLADRVEDQEVEVRTGDVKLVIAQTASNIGLVGPRVECTGFRLLTTVGHHALRLDHGRCADCFEALKQHCTGAWFIDCCGNVSCGDKVQKLSREMASVIRRHLLRNPLYVTAFALPLAVLPILAVAMSHTRGKSPTDNCDVGWLIVFAATGTAGLAHAVRGMLRYLRWIFGSQRRQEIGPQ